MPARSEEDWTSVEAVVQAVVGSLRFRRPIVDDAQLGGRAARGNDRMVRQVVPAMCAVLGVRGVVLSVRGGELDDSSFELFQNFPAHQSQWYICKTFRSDIPPASSVTN